MWRKGTRPKAVISRVGDDLFVLDVGIWINGRAWQYQEKGDSEHIYAEFAAVDGHADFLRRAVFHYDLGEVTPLYA